MDKIARPAVAAAPRSASHRWQNWLAAALALWLICSPEMVAAISATSHAGGRNDPAIWNAWLIGFLGLLVAAMGLLAARPWPSVLMLVLAAWLMVSPWQLGYEHLPFWTWNALVTGSAIGISEATVLLDRYGLLPALSPARASRSVDLARPASRQNHLHRLMDKVSSLLKSIRSAAAGTDHPGR